MQRKEDVERDWILVDADDRVLGKLATEIAELLIGKNKVTYTPHVDSGDYVVVTNASEIVLTRKKADKKVYRWHTGFIGSLKEMKFKDMLAQKPEKVIELAVKNMLPKNKMRKQRLARLKVYPGAEHPHQSQIKETKE
ncbi:MAG: 50S ribosomal protein L13 [Candidatus Pacebacteria bacterium]|nr:50S ribosomal protein L13 [Candidatus Paceibacterota bacterium]